ncbi:GntR family transcriptional regulator [Brevibacillus sp. B_LB10_24]|uniref:GntR family transcriptional regulator n=1 Tax=Brevibacillus sp. B_LB10_24 TaxID=3380645 RepID=UPI0038B6C9E2
MVTRKKYSLSEQVYRDIKELIVYGKIKPGELLTVGEMAERFNVSKTPVRDAFNELKHNGLLEVLPYKGYFVSKVNLQDLNELFTLRILLEGGAGELAAQNATKEDIEKLEELARVQFRPDDEESEIVFMKTNFNFHITLAEASNNRRLVKLIENNLDQMQRVLYLDLKIANPYAMSEEHTALVKLIKERNAEGVKKMLVSHIEASRNRVAKKL